MFQLKNTVDRAEQEQKKLKDSDSIPKELFEEEKKKRIEAETTLQLLQKILIERK